MGIALQTALRETKKRKPPAYTCFRLFLQNPSLPGRAQALIIAATDEMDARWLALHALDKKTYIGPRKKSAQATLQNIHPSLWNNPKYSTCIAVNRRSNKKGVLKIEVNED